MSITVTRKVDFAARPRRRRTPKPASDTPATPAPATDGRVPRVARLVALGVDLERKIREGEIADYADAARLGHVTRARVSQIVNLTFLAPDIIEDILFLARVHAGRDPISEHDLRPIAIEPRWERQRQMWRKVLEKANGG